MENHAREDAELTEWALTLATEMQNRRLEAMELFYLQPLPTFVGRFAQSTPPSQPDTEDKSSDPDPEPSPSR